MVKPKRTLLLFEVYKYFRLNFLVSLTISLNDLTRFPS